MDNCIGSCISSPNFIIYFLGGLIAIPFVCALINALANKQSTHLSIEISQNRQNDDKQDLRRVDGHLCKTDTDYHKWNIINSTAREMHYRLKEIAYLLSDPATENGDTIYAEWKSRYSSYRAMCIKYGMWNYQLDDCKTFIPTYSQTVAEEMLKKRIDDLYKTWVTEHSQYTEENNLILDYLRKCPRCHAIKSDLVRDLSNGDSEERKKINRIYSRLKRKGIIADMQLQGTKTFETRIVIHQKKELQPVSLSPSTFIVELYSDLDQFDLFKVQNTVGIPENIDRTKNTCTFTSLGNGEVYNTSLNMCTCPSYQNNGRCKHMVALALHLGYLKTRDFK